MHEIIGYVIRKQGIDFHECKSLKVAQKLFIKTIKGAAQWEQVQLIERFTDENVLLSYYDDGNVNKIKNSSCKNK